MRFYIWFLVLIYSPICFSNIEGRVVAVTDGDTIKVLDASNTEHRVRLTGIDAPERGQPYSRASREHLASLVAGKTVLVESNKIDRYGRVLGKVMVNGLDVNLEQLRGGYAWWYRYYAKQQIGRDQHDYEAAENTAKLSGAGLWADPSPINPYRWRKGDR